MKIYRKEWEVLLPGKIDTIWQFFSRPENLNDITPKDMAFEIISDIKNQAMYEGMLIQYKVSPILNIKMNWLTEITHIKEHEYFIDEQRFGPYALWHHQHHFKEVDGGILMKDILHYAIPLGILGQMANGIFVSKKVSSIFDYRERVVQEIFNE